MGKKMQSENSPQWFDSCLVINISTDQNSWGKSETGFNVENAEKELKEKKDFEEKFTESHIRLNNITV